MSNKTIDPALVIAATALILLGCVWLYLHTPTSPDYPTPSNAAQLQAPKVMKRISRAEGPQQRMATHEVLSRTVVPTSNQANKPEYGGDWGLVPDVLVETGQVDAASAKILNEAAVKFAGNAAQASPPSTSR